MGFLESTGPTQLLDQPAIGRTVSYANLNQGMRAKLNNGKRVQLPKLVRLASQVWYYNML